MNKDIENQRKLPMGVSQKGDKYFAKTKIDGVGIYLGSFNTPEEAHQTWLDYKEKNKDQFERDFHGLTKHPLFWVLNNLKQRCYNPKYNNYKSYGGKGITICQEWMDSCKTFVSWALENEWKEDLFIERVDENGNFEPENCVFVTKEVLKSKKIARRKGMTYKKKSNLPTGVYRNGKGFKALFFSQGKATGLGTYSTPEEASIAWQEFKNKQELKKLV